MLITVDTREKPRACKRIVEHFNKKNVRYIYSKLFVGDYQNMDNPRVYVDRKQNLSELCSNVVQDHDRFVRELERAQNNGLKLVILVEHGNGIKCLEDVKNWKNPRLKYSPMATKGETLYKILKTMSEKYEFDIQFCTKAQTGKRILEITSTPITPVGSDNNGL